MQAIIVEGECALLQGVLATTSPSPAPTGTTYAPVSKGAVQVQSGPNRSTPTIKKSAGPVKVRCLSCSICRHPATAALPATFDAGCYPGLQTRDVKRPIRVGLQAQG